MRAVDLHEHFCSSLFLEGDFFVVFRCWMDLGRLLEIKMDAKIGFSDVFLRCFFRGGLASSSGAFLEAPNLKI